MRETTPPHVALREPIDGYSPKPPEFTVQLEGPLSYKFYDTHQELSYKPSSSSSMCYVIVTCRSMAWTLLTVVSTLCIVTGIITPQWLIGRPRWVGLRSERFNGSIHDHKDKTYTPTIGIFNRCTKIHRFGDFHTDSCASYVTGFDMSNDEFPDTWKSGIILLTIGAALMTFTNFTAVFSLCIQAIFRKSIFTVSGLIQSIAGLFLIIGQLLYPLGWGTNRVRTICGDHAGPFTIDDCQIGWGFYVCMAGTAMVFGCALLSIQAENSTSSDQVETEILKGKNLICIA